MKAIKSVLAGSVCAVGALLLYSAGSLVLTYRYQSLGSGLTGGMSVGSSEVNFGAVTLVLIVLAFIAGFFWMRRRSQRPADS